MEVKICKQCGEIKPLSQFRKYYGGRKGSYKVCKACERINSREKYLRAKGECMDWDEESELMKIHELYECQRRMGLQPPTRQERSTTLRSELDNMLGKYQNMAAQATATARRDATIDLLTDAPRDLVKWLTEPLTQEPDYYMDEVYEKLVDTYRPCISIDKDQMMPVYDDKYKTILDKILERFTDYEDTYYEGAE